MQEQPANDDNLEIENPADVEPDSTIEESTDEVFVVRD